MNVVLNMLLGIHIYVVHTYLYIPHTADDIHTIIYPTCTSEGRKSKNSWLQSSRLCTHTCTIRTYIVHVQPVATMTTKLEAYVETIKENVLLKSTHMINYIPWKAI